MNLGDSIWLIISILVFGSIIYYLLFREPASTLIFTSESDDEVQRVKNYLTASGIKTYIKSSAKYRMKHYGGLANPTLHVVNPDERQRALQILSDAKMN